MARVDSLRVFKAYYQMEQNIFKVCDSIPRKDKYSLGEKIKSISLEALQLVCEANMAYGKKREEKIGCFLVKFKVLETLINLAFDRGCFSQKQKVSLIKSIGNIACQTNGWLKYTQDANLRNQQSSFAREPVSEQHQDRESNSE